MVHYACPNCQRELEVDDHLAGKQAACPYCFHVTDIPKHSKLPPGISLARPAGSSPPPPTSPRPADRPADRLEQRLAALNLPSSTADEVTIRTVHPVMFRARPWMGTGVLLLIVGGAVGAILLFLSALLPAAAACAIACVIGLVWAGAWKVHAMNVALILTNKRVIERRGLLSRRTAEAPYSRIIEVELQQTLYQRLLNVGSIAIDNAADDGNEIEVHDLPDPKGLIKIIDAYRGM